MAVSKCLHAMGKICKEGIWLPHELSKNYHFESLVYRDFFACQANKIKFFRRILTGDEKWIYFDPKPRKLWVNLQPSTSTPKKNIHEQDLALHLVGSRECAVLWALLHPNKTVTANRHQQQLCRLNDELMQKRPFVTNNRRKVILLHDNTWPHVAKSRQF